MGISIQFDTSRMNAALDRFTKGVEEDTRRLLIADEARLLFRDAMKFTPNKTLAMGRKVVSSQISRTMMVIDPLKTSPAMQRMLKSGNIDDIRNYMRTFTTTTVEPFFDENIHRFARKDGAVPKNFRQKTWLMPKGNKARLKQYISRKQSNVGTFKSAFAGIIEDLNGKGTGRTPIPNWIGRNKSKGRRLVDIARLKLTGSKPSVEWRGSIHPYLVQPLSRAIRVREQALVRKANNILKGRAAIIDGKFTILRNDRLSGRGSFSA